MLFSTTLRPGLLVSLKTSLKGNVAYRKIDLDEQHDGAMEEVKWETTRTIQDRIEYDAAKKVQSKARNIVSGVCTLSDFGLLCPERDRDMLDRAIREARKLVEEFNDTATRTRVSIFAITGTVAQDDAEAVRAISSEVSDLMEKMTSAIQKLDVEAVRKAANQARQLGNMLSPDAKARVQIAIDAARGVAKEIVKAGEAAAIEIDERAIRMITEQRTAFLDLSEEAEIARPAAQSRAVEFTSEEV